MTDPVSSISSIAGTQMAALAAAQSQQSADTSRPATTALQAVVAVPAGGAAQAGSKAAPAPAKGASTGKPSSQELGAAAKELQSYFQPNQKVTLQVDHASGESYVKIVDAKSKQLILQIPSADVLAMAQKLREMANPQAASGVLVDQQG